MTKRHYQLMATSDLSQISLQIRYTKTINERMFSKTNRINIAFYNQAWMFLDHMEKQMAALKTVIHYLKFNVS